MSFTNLMPDAANELLMEIRREGTSASFNAFRITEIPEPNTFALAALGLVALAARARSARKV